MKTDQLYIEDRPDYFSGNLVNILKFKTSNLKLDKKHGKIFIFILLVMFITIKKHRHCGSIIFINQQSVWVYIRKIWCKILDHSQRRCSAENICTKK